MSEKKASSNATILIRLNGDETTATLIQDESPGKRIARSIARRNPADAYSAYEGARIALARLYGQDPFPKQEEKPAETQKRFKVGNLARIGEHTVFSAGQYAPGDLVRVKEIHPGGYYIQVIRGSRAKFYSNGRTSYVLESELEPVAAAQEEPEKPEFKPSFRVGDIVRTGDTIPFTQSCQGRTAKVTRVTKDTLARIRYEYELKVAPKYGREFVQTCSEYEGTPAPLTLLWREEEKA